MKILVQAIKGNHLYGFKNLFEANRHQWIWWEEEHTPAFDAFDELQPDLFIGYGEPSRAVKKCLKKYQGKIRFMFQTGPYTYQIKDKTFSCRPFLVNKLIHHPGKLNKKLECDIACCEGPHPYFTSLCRPVGKFSIKIISESLWQVPQYIGAPRWEDQVSLYQSATLVFATTAEEIGRAMACGTPCITTNTEDIFGGNVIVVDSKEDMFDQCHQLLTSRKYELKEMSNKGLKFIDDNKLTYDHAFEKICTELNI